MLKYFVEADDLRDVLHVMEDVMNEQVEIGCSAIVKTDFQEFDLCSFSINEIGSQMGGIYEANAEISTDHKTLQKMFQSMGFAGVEI